jgi:hypothetical protein
MLPTVARIIPRSPEVHSQGRSLDATTRSVVLGGRKPWEGIPSNTIMEGKVSNKHNKVVVRIDRDTYERGGIPIKPIERQKT